MVCGCTKKAMEMKSKSTESAQLQKSCSSSTSSKKITSCCSGRNEKDKPSKCCCGTGCGCPSCNTTKL